LSAIQNSLLNKKEELYNEITTSDTVVLRSRSNQRSSKHNPNRVYATTKRKWHQQ